jgi:hypothetical protein
MGAALLQRTARWPSRLRLLNPAPRRPQICQPETLEPSEGCVVPTRVVSVLTRIRAAMRLERVRFTQKALSEIAQLPCEFDERDACDVLDGLRSADFDSMAATIRTWEVLYVFKPEVAVAPLRCEHDLTMGSRTQCTDRGHGRALAPAARPAGLPGLLEAPRCIAVCTLRVRQCTTPRCSCRRSAAVAQSTALCRSPRGAGPSMT